MGKTLLLVLGGLVCLSYTPIIVGQDADPGTHEITGPAWVLWEARYSGPAPDARNPQSIAVNPDGTAVFVTGISYDDQSTVAYDATGEETWVASGWFYSVAVSPDGSAVFAAGMVVDPETDRDYATVAYDAATGEEIWTARYDGPASSSDWAQHVSVSPDGGTVFVTGTSYALWTQDDYATLAYDAATGEELWLARYDGVFSVDRPRSMAISPDGSMVFVTGNSARFGYATVAYDASTGDEIWFAGYDGPATLVDLVSEIAISADGSKVFLTGMSGDYRDYSRRYDWATVAYEATTGDEIWVARYSAPLESEAWNIAGSLGVSPDGNSVFVTGSSMGLETGDDCTTIAYDAVTGDEIWVARYDGPASGRDYGTALVVSLDGGRVVVTGQSEGIETDNDYATIAYDAETGEETWLARYDGPDSGRDEATEIVMSPGGTRVFVTGHSGIPDTDFRDYVTIAYSLVPTIEIDVKPANPTNPINPRIWGVTPVALLGSEELDVTEVDVTRLRFGPDEAAPTHDLTDGRPYREYLRDVNLDGFTDLLAHFDTQETGIQCGDTAATLTGQLMDGTTIEGTDSIRTVGCSHKAQSKHGRE